MKTRFKKYLDNIPENIRKNRSDQFWIDDFIGSNLKILESTIKHAERIQGWGANSHAGNRNTYMLRNLWDYLKKKKNRKDPEYEEKFYDAMKIRQTLGDLIFRAENGYK